MFRTRAQDTVLVRERKWRTYGTRPDRPHALMRTDFTRSLGKFAYHVACHLRVQNIGLKTRDMLRLIPGPSVHALDG
ncbi:MAG: hypothetical protein NVS1B6_03250 [Steroidobacteraceae bacterium]